MKRRYRFQAQGCARAQAAREGRKPFGAKPGEAEVVAYIVKLRRKPKGGERLSFAAIADRLNAEGVPTRTGRPWAAETVRGIVQRGG